MEGAAAGTGEGVAAQRTSIRPVAEVTARAAVAITVLAAVVMVLAAAAVIGNRLRNIM